MGSVVHSVKRDIEDEGTEMLDRFHLVRLPEYEPAYIYRSKVSVPTVGYRDIENTDPEYESVANLDYFFMDAFNALGDPKQIPINLEDSIISGLKTSEDIYSFIGSDGDLILYNQTTGIETDRQDASFKSNTLQEREEFNERTNHIPGSIDVVSIIDENGDTVPYTSREAVANERYESAYDLNSNGVIDQEDLDEFIAAQGISYEDVEPEVWNTTYNRLDINKDGVIDEKEVQKCTDLLYSVGQSGTVLEFEEPTARQLITYRQVTAPEIQHIYRNRDEVLSNRVNSLGSLILQAEIDNSPGELGIAEPETASFIVEIDKNRDVNFVRLDGVRVFKSRVSWLDADFYEARLICSTDDILFIYTVHRENLDERIYVVDMKKPAVEFTEQFLNIDTGDGVEVLFMSADDRPANELQLGVRLSDGRQEIWEYPLIKKFYTIQDNYIWTSRKTDQLVEFGQERLLDGESTADLDEAEDGEDGAIVNEAVVMPQVPIKIQNSVDDYAFNWGDERVPGETNRIFKKRLLDYWRHLQGADRTGLLYGIGKAIGIPVADAILLRPTESTSIKLADQWSIQTPLTFLFVDEEQEQLEILAFRRYEDQSVFGRTRVLLSELVRAGGSLVEIPDEYASYDRNFPDEPTARDLAIKIPDSETATTGSFDFDGDEVPDNTAVYDNGVIDFSACPEVLRNFGERKVFVFLDSVDLVGNIHLLNREELEMPYFQPEAIALDPLIRIESLLYPGSYRERYIDDPVARQQLINDQKERDTSSWNKTEFDISFYNTRAKSGEVLKPTEWSGLSFNDNFDPNNEDPWDF